MGENRCLLDANAILRFLLQEIDIITFDKKLQKRLEMIGK